MLAPLLCLFAASPVAAKWSIPDCPDFQRAEFRYVKIVTKAVDSTLDEPLKADFDRKPDGGVDIWFVERHGKVKRYEAASRTVSVVGSLDVYSDSPARAAQTGDTETGLDGIVLDPAFAANHWLYLYYSAWAKPEFRVSRFTVNAGKLDMQSEKILLAIPEGRIYKGAALVLPGGALAFDPSGDLWIAVGADSKLAPSVSETDRIASAEASASDMADLRGSLLRIHPDNSEKGYSVPAGNLGAYWSERFAAQGEADLAKEYADPAKVLPEIYVKGTRNPYSLSVDPVKRWAAWGDFGPNGYSGQKVEELDLAAHPSFAGYPYWSGRNYFLLQGVGSQWNAMDPAAPVNASKWNTGPRRLPPAEPALYAYAAASGAFVEGNHPVTGPIYRYPGALASDVKFPPHFEGSWFTVDFASPGLRVFQIGEDGSSLSDSLAFLPDLKFERPLDLKQGPDGALYVVDYGNVWHGTSSNAAIGRIEYTGTCRPVRAGAARATVPPQPHAITISGDQLRFGAVGQAWELRIGDLHGREVRLLRGRGEARLSSGATFPGPGLWQVRLRTAGGTQTALIPAFPARP